MSAPYDAVVILLCKAPEKGRVKTRLALDVGDDRALFVYSMMLAQLIENLNVSERNTSYDVLAFVDGNQSLMQVDGLRLQEQRGNDLGERIMHAINECARYTNKIVIGSDTPTVTKELIIRAIAELQLSDVVIGPSEDGGYYLIGIKDICSDLFSEISWSTELVFEQTLQRAQNHDLLVSVLPTLRDIDTIEDLRAVMPDLLETRR